MKIVIVAFDYQRIHTYCRNHSLRISHPDVISVITSILDAVRRIRGLRLDPNNCELILYDDYACGRYWPDVRHALALHNEHIDYDAYQHNCDTCRGAP